MLRAILSLALFVSVWGLPPPARADLFYHLVEANCAPEISYFSVRTHGLYNIQLTPERRTALAERGLFTLSDAAARTLSCDLGEHEIVVDFDLIPPVGRGPCGGLERGSLVLLVDGREVHRTSDTHDGCPGPLQLDIRAHAYGVFVCEIRFEQQPDQVAPPAQTTCVTPIWYSRY